MTSKQAAAKLGYTIQGVNQLCRQDKLKWQWFGDNRMIDTESVEQYKPLAKLNSKQKKSK